MQSNRASGLGRKKSLIRGKKPKREVRLGSHVTKAVQWPNGAHEKAIIITGLDESTGRLETRQNSVPGWAKRGGKKHTTRTWCFRKAGYFTLEKPNEADSTKPRAGNEEGGGFGGAIIPGRRVLWDGTRNGEPCSRPPKVNNHPKKGGGASLQNFLAWS